MKTISWNDFENVDIRVGTILEVQDFPEIKNPSYKIWVDFGKELWIKKTSAQVTKLYSKEELIWKQILWVVNFPPKQIGKFMSEFLLTWFYTEDGVILWWAQKRVENGLRLL